MDLQAAFQAVKGALDNLEASLALLNTLSGRVQALETLLKGIERTVSPDGIEGLYIPMRVGINTKYWMLQPFGKGAGLSVVTGFDRFACYVQHDGGDTVDNPNTAKERVALSVLNTDLNPHGDNIGVVAIACNAGVKNLGLTAQAAGPGALPFESHVRGPDEP